MIAEDGDAAATAVDKAAEAGVKVLAYDRLIKSPNIAAYLSFNNEEVGRQQAMGVMSAIDIENWDVAAKGKVKLVKLGGSPTDNDAILFRKGQDEILDKYKDKKIGSGGRPVGRQLGSGERAEVDGKHLDGASQQDRRCGGLDDGTALGALQAMKAQQLAGVVPISGQDATADGCNSIVKGELTVSILKDIRNLSPWLELTDGLLKGTVKPEPKSTRWPR